MMDFAAHGDDGADDAAWWFKDDAGRSGPVSTSELRRLAQGPLGPATLVWRKAFGERWKRLDEALEPSRASDGPPSGDYGRWTRTFESFEKDPDKLQWSWFGLFGIAAYLWLGMWRRALVLVSIVLAWRIVMDLAGVPQARLVPGLLVIGFSMRNLKRDYYRHRLLGEPMWRPLRLMAPGWACGGAVAALAIVLVLALNAAHDPASAMISQVAGVWQGEDYNVVIDVAGDRKTISFDGKTYPVALRSSDDDHETIVFQDISDPGTIITLQKSWDAKHEHYTISFVLNDRLVANLLYIRPV